MSHISGVYSASRFTTCNIVVPPFVDHKRNNTRTGLLHSTVPRYRLLMQRNRVRSYPACTRRDGAMRMYWELGKRSFQQQFAYRAATLAGLFTNSIFGVMLTSVYLALFWDTPESASVGGFTAQQTISYTWIGQALIAPVMFWGWWLIIDTIRSGSVVMDMLKPMDFFRYWLSRDLGRAAGQMLTRAIPTLTVGAILFDLEWPESWQRWVAFLISVPFAIIVSFCVRFMLNLWGFWLMDHRGVGSIALVVTGVFSGHLLPISWYPPILRDVMNVLPFRSMLMTPVEIWLGQVSIAQGLAMQVFWATVMIGCCYALLHAAERKVVVQGG